MLMGSYTCGHLMFPFKSPLLKKIVLAGVFFFCCYSLFSQREQIDSLRRALSLLSDSARVDCLNEFSLQYTQLEKKDSAQYFANIALSVAQELNYIHGIAVSLCRKSQIAKHFDDDLVSSEKLAKEKPNSST